MRKKTQELPVSVGWYEKGKKVNWSGKLTRKKKEFIINAISDSGSQCYSQYGKNKDSPDKTLAQQAELASEYHSQCSRAVLYLQKKWQLIPWTERGRIDYEIAKLDYFEQQKRKERSLGRKKKGV